MKDIKEIGKVIRVVEHEDETHMTIHRDIVMDDKEYRILPVRCGEIVDITPDLNAEEVVAKAKEGLFKHLEKYIDIYVCNDLAFNNQIVAKVSLVIITDKERSKDEV